MILNDCEDAFSEYPSNNTSFPEEYENRNMPSIQNKPKSVSFSKDTIFNNPPSRIRNSLYPSFSDSSAMSGGEDTEYGEEENGPLMLKPLLHQSKKEPGNPMINIKYNQYYYYYYYLFIKIQ